MGLVDWQLYIHQLGGAADAPEASLSELYRSHSEIFCGIVDQDTHVNHTMDLVKSFAGQVLVIPTHEANIQILRPNTTISVMANLIPNVLKHVLENQGVSQAIKIAGMKIRQPDERISELQKIMTNYP